MKWPSQNNEVMKWEQGSKVNEKEILKKSCKDGVELNDKKREDELGIASKRRNANWMNESRDRVQLRGLREWREGLRGV